MKVMIEIDLPDGQKIPTSDDILRLTSPNWISDWWHIDDVSDCLDPEYHLSEDDCREVLRRVLKYRDANEGINWSTLMYVADAVSKEKERAKA